VLLVVALSVLRAPPFLAILAGALAGAVMAAILQPRLVLQLADTAHELPAWLGMIKGAWHALATGFVYVTGDPKLDTLLSRGGMDSMLPTIWLIMAAMAYGAVMQHAGLLDRIIAPAVRAARSTASLVAAVVASAIGMNIVAGDQYLAVVLPGRMFKAEFARRGLPAPLLSRTIGDSGIVTGPLVPWNSCGAFMAAALGVGTLDFLPYAFFNLVNPLVTIIAALLVGGAVAAAGQPGSARR
jgi:NhaC family Na+:H+ antiporter